MHNLGLEHNTGGRGSPSRQTKWERAMHVRAYVQHEQAYPILQQAANAPPQPVHGKQIALLVCPASYALIHAAHPCWPLQPTVDATAASAHCQGL